MPADRPAKRWSTRGRWLTGPGLGGNTLVSGWGLLVAAAALVGVALALDSSVGRFLNGVGGVIWLMGAGALLADTRRPHFERA